MDKIQQGEFHWKTSNGKKQEHITSFWQWFSENLSPPYTDMKEEMSSLKNIRNGFDHGWTAESQEKLKDIKEQAKQHFDLLNEIFSWLHRQKDVLDQKFVQKWKNMQSQS
jgi:hypothetical protein